MKIMMNILVCFILLLCVDGEEGYDGLYCACKGMSGKT